MRSQRALRRYTSEEVPDELVLRLLELALHAPSGTNRQGWEFVVLRDPARKARLGSLNRWPARLFYWAGRILGRPRRMLESLRWQAEHFAEIPVIVVPCYRGRPPCWPFLAQASWWASAMPAVQNLLLAARAAGLGSVLLTLPMWRIGAFKRALGLPWGVTPCAVIPLGWPLDRHGPNRRGPVAEKVHLDRFGHRPFLPTPNA